MDPLSDVLSLLKPRSYMFRGLDAGGRWAIRFPAVDGLNCYCLSSGACWLSVDGLREPLPLSAGDCILLPGKRAFSFFSHTGSAAVAAETVVTGVGEGGTVRLNEGGECSGVGGYYSFAADPNDLLFGVLPPILHIRRDEDKAELRWCVERMMRELREREPGRALVAEHLAHLLLVQALRLYMAEGPAAGVGWLSALGDRQLSAALTAMHKDPGRRWTLQALAALAGMSRSAFALRFKEAVGRSAIDYLTRWRMLLAADRLLNGREPVSLLAPSLGYSSESAFSTAFKRVVRCSPRQYGRRVEAAA